MPKAPSQTNRLLTPDHHLATDPTDCQVEDLLVAGGAADAGFGAEGFEGGGRVLGEPAESAEEAWGRGHSGGLRCLVGCMGSGDLDVGEGKHRRCRVSLGAQGLSA
jgi:hypothetical protein